MTPFETLIFLRHRLAPRAHVPRRCHQSCRSVPPALQPCWQRWPRCFLMPEDKPLMLQGSRLWVHVQRGTPAQCGLHRTAGGHVCR